MVKPRCALFAICAILIGCGSPKERIVISVRISPYNECTFDRSPSDCANIGAAIVQVHPHSDLEVHICAHKHARYETVAGVLSSLESSGIERIGFIDLNPANGKPCTSFPSI